MHPIPPSRLAYNLPSRNESSFPERHAWSEPDDISHLSGGDVTYTQPGFPKLDIFTPGLSSFWQQNWLDQSQPLPHRGPVRPTRHGVAEMSFLLTCHRSTLNTPSIRITRTTATG